MAVFIKTIAYSLVYDPVILKQIFIYSPVQPIESTEFILRIERIEFMEPALARLVVDAKLRPLPADSTENIDPNDKRLNTDKNDNIE